MGQFTLNWDNTLLLATPNSIAQRASYRRKDVGGAWNTAGFAPANDLLKTAITTLSPSLLDNVIYEFKVETLCETGGPTGNVNGLKEQINFACIAPTINSTDVASTATVDVTGLNITQVTFSLARLSDHAIIHPYTIVNVVGGMASVTAIGLTASTAYYWNIELISAIDGDGVISSTIDHLGAVCSPYNTVTTAPATCVAPEDLEVLSNEP